MRIQIEVGDQVEITLKDSDGRFLFVYGDQAVTVEADLPDTDGRSGVIYSERYAESNGASEALAAEIEVLRSPRMSIISPDIPWSELTPEEQKIETEMGIEGRRPDGGCGDPSSVKEVPPGPAVKGDPHYLTPGELAMEARMALEVKFVRMVVEDAVAQGWMVSVNNGGDESAIEDSTDVEAIMNEMYATDEDHLFVKKCIGSDQFTLGTIRFVYGNEPWKVLCDHSSPKVDEIVKRYDRETELYARSIGAW